MPCTSKHRDGPSVHVGRGKKQVHDVRIVFGAGESCQCDGDVFPTGVGRDGHHGPVPFGTLVPGSATVDSKLPVAFPHYHGHSLWSKNAQGSHGKTDAIERRPLPFRDSAVLVDVACVAPVHGASVTRDVLVGEAFWYPPVGRSMDPSLPGIVILYKAVRKTHPSPCERLSRSRCVHS